MLITRWPPHFLSLSPEVSLLHVGSHSFHPPSAGTSFSTLHARRMAMSLREACSGKSNAPGTPHSLRFAEKANFAGIVTGAIFYGTEDTSV